MVFLLQELFEAVKWAILNTIIQLVASQVGTTLEEKLMAESESEATH